MRQASSQGDYTKWWANNYLTRWPIFEHLYDASRKQELEGRWSHGFSAGSKEQFTRIVLIPTRPVRVPCITFQHHTARILFVCTHFNCQLRQWRHIVQSSVQIAHKTAWRTSMHMETQWWAMHTCQVFPVSRQIRTGICDGMGWHLYWWSYGFCRQW